MPPRVVALGVCQVIPGSDNLSLAATFDNWQIGACRITVGALFAGVGQYVLGSPPEQEAEGNQDGQAQDKDQCGV